MYIIGENIHIISPKVKVALKERNKNFFQESAIKQVEAGASAIDLNMGPRKKDWEEVFPWIVKAVEEVVDVPLVIDTTNVNGMEAALKAATKAQPILNSTSAEAERLEKVPLLAKKYGARLIALTMEKSGIPVGADERVGIALEKLIPRLLELDYNMQDLIIDPLVLTVSGCQEFCPELIEAVRTLQYAWDPPPGISVGLSNVSNAVPNENRPLINQVYCAMLMGAGLNMMIADPFDKGLRETIRVIEDRDETTDVGKLYIKISDRVAAMEEPSIDDVNMSDPKQAEIWKTVQILLNKVIYADSYLQQ
ncbi:MAG: dihydropteroate synthase [Chloroflexi bacterium]|jgi:5-methyltetrahydrofolate corrinoid/iron sulfur protein methyltransferase|nr:dihydropteroate synthase [Chloroflexota bacterium]MBT4002564.1 dihydropteroate synthase [Chloroflexota bacterium]MBT4305894.1 dihydropteroate synthase [Chloroflexota bacterium]MBT4533719.1 dihydropteroate synthase [Chloroflexota bacterium]MBT4681638.1 dihydropteroate synthase [Chloroflexota bacterium]